MAFSYLQSQDVHVVKSLYQSIREHLSLYGLYLNKKAKPTKNINQSKKYEI